MHVTRIDMALEDCETHLADTNSFGTPIERLLTDSLLVVIYAEFEQTINSIVQQRCDSIGDDSLKQLVRKCIGSISRIQSGSMGDLLQRFGDQRRESFKSEIEANQRAETFYNNLITNRHDTAHSVGSNLSFAEVKLFYQEGHAVLDFFKEALLSTDVD